MREKQNNAEIKSNVECSKTVFESPFLHNIKIGLGVKLGFKNFFLGWRKFSFCMENSVLENINGLNNMNSYI